MSAFSAPLETFQKISVLLIDDQPIIAEKVKFMLSSNEEISFHYCQNPCEAIKFAEAVNPTVILQDLVMPECDGLELVKRFRSHPATKEIPLIVLSSNDEPVTKAEAFSLGASDYLIKLPDKIELLARIRYHSSNYIRLLQRNEAYEKLRASQKALNKELSEAAEYVRSILPKPIKTGEICTSWRFIPSAQLGGDAFGYHWVDKENFAFYLIDVCGHGIGAALLSISLINTLRDQNLPHADFLNPSDVLKRLNEIYLMERHHEMFSTGWYGIYNTNTRQLTYACAGHPPALLFSQSDLHTMHQLKTPGFVIGGMPGIEFTNQTIQIEPESKLYIYSDGVYEIKKADGTMLQLEDFIEFLKTIVSNRQNLDQIVIHAEKMGGNRLFADDFSILEIQFKRE